MSEFAEQLFNDLGNNEYGQTLKENIRFGRFKPDNISNDVWVDVLGSDVDNYYHHEYTAGLTAWYIFEADRLGQPLSRENQATLMMTAWTHDFAEAIDGDVPDPDKDHSEDAKFKGRQSFLRVMGSVCSTPNLMGVAVFPVLYGGCDLARDFRAIELIGYAQTGIKAGIEAYSMRDIQRLHNLSIPQLKSLHDALKSLYEEVTPSAHRSLEAFSDLPVVKEYLRRVS